MEPGVFLWLKHFYMMTGKEKFEQNARDLLRLGKATDVLTREAADHLGLTSQGHNWNDRVGAFIGHAEDPKKYAQKWKDKQDHIHKRFWITDPSEVEAIKLRSGLLGLDDPSGHYNIACLTPHDLTVNTRTMCQLIQSYLEKNCDVKSHFGCNVVKIDQQETANGKMRV